jgi:hypothetical protein
LSAKEERKMSSKDQLKEMLSKFTPQQLRVFLYELEEHKCNSALMRCCNELRCETCHIRHMHEKHSSVARSADAYFRRTGNILPLTKDEKQIKEKKQPKKRSFNRTQTKSTEVDITQLNEEQLLKLMEEIKMKLNL